MRVPWAFLFMELRTAILIDGSFFINRANFFKRKYFASQPEFTAEKLIEVLNGVTRRHLSSNSNSSKPTHYLYRSFYYDAAPLDISIHYPLSEKGESGKRMKHFLKDPANICRNEFLKKLKTQRKMALRLGSVKHQKNWNIKQLAVKDLLSGELTIENLTNDHFYFESQQKGVDIKLGVDIATLAFEKLVDQIVLIAGDSDFVPAAKLARTKGIDFVLDSLRNNIDPSLNEHIDGLNNFDLVSIISEVLHVQPDIRPSWWQDEEARKESRSKRPRHRNNSQRRKK